MRISCKVARQLILAICFILHVCICTAFQPGSISPNYTRLKNFSIGNGLPGETVRTVYQDNEGYIWMGIESFGLCRFNGVQYDIYGHITNDSSSLSSDFVEVITEDKNGNLWIGTDFGLNKLNKGLISMSMGKRFTQYFHVEDNPASISGNSINAIVKNSKGELWIGTSGGLNILNDDNETFRNFQFTSNPAVNKKIQVNAIYEDIKNNLWIGTNKGLYLISPKREIIANWNRSNSQLKKDHINTICEDKNGMIWLGTQSGIHILDPENNTFDHIKFSGKASYMYYAGINKIKKTNDEKLWIGSFSNGLLIYDIVNNSYQYFNSQDKNPDGIMTNQIRDFCQDKNGVVWIAVKNNGLYTYDKRIETFEYITEMSEEGLGLSDKQVISIYEDKKGAIWIGTRFGGLNKYDPIKKRFTYFRNNPNNPYSITSNRIESIIEDKEGLLWLTTVDGLFKFNRSENRFYHYEFGPIKVIREDARGQLWLGTKKGIYRFDKQKLTFIPVRPKNNSEQIDKLITSLLIDSYGIIWAGTYNSGLLEYHPETNEITRYKNNNSPGSLGNNMIRAIYEDELHRLWVGSKQEGFDLFDRNTKKFKKFNTNDGLPTNSVFSITGDNEGNIWLATNGGISKFDPIKSTFTNFTSDFGLQGDIFISGAACKAKDGKLYFGGDNGLNAFYPKNIRKTEYDSPILITKIKSNEKFIKPENFKNKKLVFGYSDYLSFEFALLNFKSLQKNTYAYKLIGLNSDWIYTKSGNYVSYINLPPGKYQFIVKGADLNGKWSSSQAVINFEILPPWWMSWQARVVYLITIAAAIYFSYRLVRFKALKENEVKVLKIEKERSESLSNFKIRFFTNISHEIRTPLTLMLPTVEKLNSLKSMPCEASDQLFILKKNTNRLLNLVDELLEFRKIEQGQVTLKPVKSDIIGFISEVTSMFREAVYLKNIEFLVDSEYPKFEMFFDPGAIEKILSNLLSNAYKFTGENGRIELTISSKFNSTGNSLKNDPLLNQEDEFIEIIVKDTGKGIPKDVLNHIFERYYIADTSDLTNPRGIGIGLDFTKSLVQLHHGFIYAESIENIGSTFKILLPVNEKYYCNDEFIKVPLQSEKYITGFNSALLSKISGPTNVIGSGVLLKKTHTILIVEDDIELLNLLSNILSEEYQVWIASDGDTGLKLAQENLPDLIVSDIFMPGLDGNSLCKKIKSEFRTSHIPFILLSANAGIDNKIEGFENGADSYISKPFHVKQLKVEIANLIKSRQYLKELFRKDIYLQPKELNIPSMDEKFITKCIAAIDKFIAEPEFGVVELGKEVGLSRSQLFRKLKALLGQSPFEFIYSTRLKTAARLIENKECTISEAAYMTGFSSPASFSTSFRRYFGMSPSQFLTEHRKVII